MTRRSMWTTAAALLVPVASAVAAQPAAAQSATVRGQIRPRYEFRDPAAGGKDASTSMRVRLAVDAVLDPGLTAFVQFQDVRLWGEETNTLSDYQADALDVHQAYLRYNPRVLPWLTGVVGRQETNLGGQRLVGPVDWTQQARSFDGVRFDLEAGAHLPVTLMAYKLADATAAAHDADAELFGAYATAKAFGPGDLDVYLLYDRSLAAAPTRQSTFGARYVVAGPLSARVEGSLQRGDRAGASVDAFMVGARVGQTFAGGRAGATLWYDYLSGDSDPADGTQGAFSTLYATNHKFYGFADLFLDVPAHTAGAGLRDLALKLNWKPTARVRVGVDVHTFSAAEQGALSTAHFADELDLTVAHAWTPHLTMTSGLSLVSQYAALAEVGRLSRDMTWGYVMLNAVF